MGTSGLQHVEKLETKELKQKALTQKITFIWLRVFLAFLLKFAESTIHWPSFSLLQTIPEAFIPIKGS